MHNACKAYERVTSTRKATCDFSNFITMSRIFCVPLLIWLLSRTFPFHSFYGEAEILGSALFILASITDGVDGYLARKRGQITTMGMLLVSTGG